MLLSAAEFSRFYLFARRKLMKVAHCRSFILRLNRRNRFRRNYSSREQNLGLTARRAEFPYNEPGTSKKWGDFELPSVADHMKPLLPSPHFLNRLAENELKRLSPLIKEFELYTHLTDEYPSEMTDFHWEQYTKCPDIPRRIHLLAFLAELELARLKLEKNEAMRMERLKVHVEKRTNGDEMFYAKDFHQLLTSPFEDYKALKLIFQSRRLAVSRSTEPLPRIVVNFDYFGDRCMDEDRYMAGQIAEVLETNFFSRRPFPLAVSGCDNSRRTVIQQRLDATLPPAFIENCIQPFIVGHTVQQLYLDPTEIICISPNALTPFEGPLDETRIYVLTASWNLKGESLRLAKVGPYRARRLPLDESFNWRRGALRNLPLNATVGILRSVVLNGGNWRRAIVDHVPAHFYDPNCERSEGERKLELMKKQKKLWDVEIVDELKRLTGRS